GMYAVARAAELIEQRAMADGAACAWWRVALTLGEANHDNSSMLKPRFMTHPPVRFDFLPRAMAMFPDEIGFRFSEARLHARTLSALLELESPRPRVVQAQPGLFVFGMGFLGAPSKRQLEELDEARRLLAPLTTDPTVGAGARFWSGYLQWTTGDLAGGRDTISGVAGIDGGAGAADPDLRYTAAVMLGYIDQALGRVSDALTDFATALRFRPKSQTASFALAALLYRDGKAEDAEQLVSESLGPRGSDEDPWRLLQYGDLAQLPAQIDALRSAVAGAAK
ncbi:MAG: tetratricopeptide repeat protein, partial [Acidobacteriota bacterium]